jgi:hypothetical protein
VHPFRGELEHGADAERFYAVAVDPVLDQFVSRPTFEEICRDYVRELIARGEIPGVERVGAWWGPLRAPRPDNPRYQVEGELEVVAAAGNAVVLAGEAKWTNQSVGERNLNHLRDVVRQVPGVVADLRLMLFGRRFHSALARVAQDQRLRLVTPPMLYK